MPVVAADHPIPPPGRIPGILPLREYVATTEHAAMMLLEVRAYSQGCLVEIAALVRHTGAADEGWDRTPPDVAVVLAGETLSGGDTSADRQRAVHRLDPPPVITERVLRHTVALWITPLPPVEAVTMRLDWPAHGIHGATAVLDGGSIRQAAWESFPFLPA
jgi:hypothetical protein